MVATCLINPFFLVKLPSSSYSVSVSINQSTMNGILYEATPVDIICDVTVNESLVDTPLNIGINWLFEQNLIISGDDYDINDNTLRIKQLNRSRDNITCLANLTFSSAFVGQ